MPVQRLFSECILCLLKKHLNDLPENITEPERVEYLQRMLEIFSKADSEKSGPYIVWQINTLKEEMFGIKSDFTAVKRHFNKLIVSMENTLRDMIKSSQNPLKTALKLSMMGNYIDFGAMNSVDEDTLMAFINKAEDIAVDEKEFTEFKKELSGAKNIVFLTDNCGEIVFDKLFIEEMLKEYKNAAVCAIVRGEPVLNDATMEDAIDTGLCDMVKVISNGIGASGTPLDAISKEARFLIDNADVIISKGQGNFETLRLCGKNVYYAFLCKCDMFQKRFNVEKYTGVFVNDKNLLR